MYVGQLSPAQSSPRAKHAPCPSSVPPTVRCSCSGFPSSPPIPFIHAREIGGIERRAHFGGVFRRKPSREGHEPGRRDVRAKASTCLAFFRQLGKAGGNRVSRPVPPSVRCPCSLSRQNFLWRSKSIPAAGRAAGRVFQRLEKFFARFPMIGKNFRVFSNDWKVFSNGWKIFAAPRASGRAEGRGGGRRVQSVALDCSRLQSGRQSGAARRVPLFRQSCIPQNCAR